MHRSVKRDLPFVGRPFKLRSLFVLIAFNAVFFLATSCFAQIDRSGLTGIVTDSTGQLLPRTRITAVQDATQLRRETVSSSNGSYDIPELPVGIYKITFDHPDFKPLTFVQVKQAIGQTRTLNVTLQVAGREEQVQVSTISEQIDRSSDALGTRIEKIQADKLPLNGRNWANLTALVPGAVDTGAATSDRFASWEEGVMTTTLRSMESMRPTLSIRLNSPTCGYPSPWTQSRSFVSIQCWEPPKLPLQEGRNRPLPLPRAPIGGMETSSSFYAIMFLTLGSPYQ